MARRDDEVTAILQAWGQRIAMADHMPCISSPPLDGGSGGSGRQSKPPQGVSQTYGALLLRDVPAAVIDECIKDMPVERRNVAYAHYVQAVSRQDMGMARSTYYQRLAAVHRDVTAALSAWRSSLERRRN